MPDDLLGPLAEGPVPPLAPATAVRARGDQRRRRARALYAGAGALTLALAGVTGAALTSDGGDSLRPAPRASAAPVVAEEPLQAALLDPEDVVLDGEWALRRTEIAPFDTTLRGCGASTQPAESATAVRYLDGPAPAVLGTHLSLYPDAGAAAQAYSARRAALAACGEVAPGVRLLGAGTDVAQRQYGALLQDGMALPFSLEQVGRVVVAVVLQGPDEPSPELADAAAEEVRDVFGAAAPAPSPTRSPAAARVSPAQLLDPAAVKAAVGGSWSVDGDDREEFYPLRHGCSDIPPAVSGLVRGLRGTAGQRVGHQLLRYADEARAREHVERWADELDRCPVRQLDSDDGTETYARLELEGSGASRSYARVTYQPACAGCQAVRTALAASVVGAHVSYISVGAGDAEDLPALADAADARVRGEDDSAAREPSPSPAPRDVDELLLTVADANRAEPGDWRREGQDVEEPLLDPCDGGTAYPRDADRVDSAVVELGSRREAGGTALVQVVARYSSEEAAVDAAQGYERAVRACPVRDTGEQPPGSRRTHEVVDEYEVGGVPTLLVRSELLCEGCVTGYVYAAVQQAGDVVSVLLAEVGEDGDPGADLVRPFAEQAAGRLS